MKHLKKFESKEEINEKLNIVSGAIKLISEYDKLETYEIIEMIEKLQLSDKAEINEIYDSLKGNRYTGNNSHTQQKDECMMELIRKYCSEIWY